MLENVLSFSGRKEERSLEELQLGLERAVQSALVIMAAAMKREEIEPTVEIEVGLRVMGDGDALAQVFGNLFSNVVKYGGRGSEMLVRGIEDGDKVVLLVCDSGAGIRSEDRERIFKPFLRLSDRVNEGVSGSGLGLAISRDLVEAMGGSLRCVERGEGKEGACFEVRLKKAGAEVVPFEQKVS